MTIQVGVFAVVGLVQAALLWSLIRACRTVATLEAKLSRQADALSLLTETSEAGFTLIARELERAAAAGTKPARKPATRRLASAVRKGKSAAEIAAAEGVSEGEVHLRLHLAGARGDGGVSLQG